MAIFGCLLLLAALTVVSWRTYIGQGERAVEEKLTELRDAGYMLTLDEKDRRYHDPSLNPAENAAPLYREAMSRLRSVPREVNELSGPVREALLELGRGENPPAETAAELAEALKQNAKVLEAFRAAAGKPYARFDLNFNAGHKLLIPHVGAMRHGARLLGLQAMQQSLDGSPEIAAETLETALAMAAHLADEGTLISQLTRIAMAGIVCETLEWLLARDTLSPTTLERLDSSLRRHETTRGLPLAMEGEMAFGNAVFTGSPLAVFEEQDRLEAKGPAILHVLSGRVHRDHHFYLNAMEDRLKAIREPLETWHSYDDSNWQREAGDEGHMFSALLIPGIGNVLLAEVNAVARVRIARILLAMERYRTEEGELPENLEALTPRFLETLPLDPVSGDPFQMKREEGWLILESEGQIRQGPDREIGPIQGRLPLSTQ